jgi:hypothetical protein
MKVKQSKLENRLLKPTLLLLLLIIIAVVSYGIAIPFLISYRDDMMVIGGIIYGIVISVGLIFFGVKIIRIFIKKENKL